MSFLDWKVGDKVVCIKRDGWSDCYPDEHYPVEGGVYTIRDIEADDDGVFIRLEEIINPQNCMDEVECNFLAVHFRPIQARKTSIEVFKRLLTPSEHDKHLIEVHDFVSLQGDLQ